MRARHPQGFRSVAGRRERLHQATHDPGVVRPRAGALPPPASRRRRVVLRLGSLGQRLQRVAVSLREPGPLPVHPLLEGRGSLEPEAVQEGSAVALHGSLGTAGIEGALERDHVAADGFPIEPEVVARGCDRFGSEPAPHPVQTGVQPAARRGFGDVGPEEADDLALASGPGRGGGQEGQQCQWMATGGRTADRAGLVLQNGPAEQGQMRHGGPKLQRSASHVTHR